MTKQEAYNQYQTLLGERLANEVFPDDKLAIDFVAIKDAAFATVSLAFIQQNFGIGWNEYRDVFTKRSNFSLYEINLINAVVLSRTPSELSGFNYVIIMDRIEEMRKDYDALLKPIQQSIQKRIEIVSNPKGQHKEKPVKFIN